MLEALSERLGAIFDRLANRGRLSESDVADVLREVRVALLEADVALPVVIDNAIPCASLPADAALWRRPGSARERHGEALVVADRRRNGLFHRI
jgi:hypothetical protein